MDDNHTTVWASSSLRQYVSPTTEALLHAIFDTKSVDDIRQYATQLSIEKDRTQPSIGQNAYLANEIFVSFKAYLDKLIDAQKKLNPYLDSKEIEAQIYHEDGKKFFLLDENVEKDLNRFSNCREKVAYPTRLLNPVVDTSKYMRTKPLDCSPFRHYLSWSLKSIHLESQLREYYDRSSLSAQCILDYIEVLKRMDVAYNGEYQLPLMDVLYTNNQDWVGSIKEQSDVEDEPHIYKVTSGDAFDWRKHTITKVLGKLMLSTIITIQKVANVPFELFIYMFL